ncbi:helix-turn-helix transcriptional regulator [Thiomicrorhabdus sp. 6S2-11]|uniref:Helix-turn-helix transcriptional regulator n=1 Tax=Thiomicrorhabdus marina TaxID=2818442 RepID=A0ABS3Q4J6_9GAMM|nr:metalloregulator ArsR/SmtB family transcription factor [Thiomicrorhabdus marina]MBO1927253.1 helix-turn-helix transcriptional regulator [Thiomicrorhabdus marina]
MTNSQQLEQYAHFHKAMAEPVRLRILALLSQQKSLCVCDLVSVLQLSQSTVSRHLSYLKNHGIVESWREGNWMHYALLNEHPFQAVVAESMRGLSQLDLIKEDLSALEKYQQSPRQCNL